MDFDRNEHRELKGRTVWIKTGCGKLYVTMNYAKINGEERLVELFVNMGKSGGCASATQEIIGRMVSRSLQRGMELDDIVKQLRGISCPRVAYDEKFKKVYSCIDAVSIVLGEYHSIKHEVKETGEILETTCEYCGSDNLVWEGRCYTCVDCQYSKC